MKYATRRNKLASVMLLALVLILTPTPVSAQCGSGRTCGAASSNHIGGYTDVRGLWVPGLITTESWFTAQPIYAFGNAVFYAPGVMEATARHHGYSLDEYVDGVALMSPADLGKRVWMRRPGLEWEGPFLVVDYAAQTDMYSTIYYNGEVVEVGFRTAESWGMARRDPNSQLGYRSLRIPIRDVEVAVVYQRPPEDLELAPVDYPAWWLELMTFTDHYQGQAYISNGQWNVPDVGQLPIGSQHAALWIYKMMWPWLRILGDGAVMQDWR